MALGCPATGFFVAFAEGGTSLNGFCACISATGKRSHKTTKLHDRSFQAIGVLAPQFVPLDYPILPAMRHSRCPAHATSSYIRQPALDCFSDGQGSIRNALEQGCAN